MLFDITTFTLIHVVLSLVGLVTGLTVAGGLVAGRRLERWTTVFLATTFATNVTGYGFPFVSLLPSHIVGGISLVVLAVVLIAHHVKHFAGRWHATYAAGVVLATYLNAFVLVAQLFRRIPALIVAAPTQSEPPFAITQLLVLACFVWLGIAAVKGFRAARAGAPDAFAGLS
jgi:hypothetical protein